MNFFIFQDSVVRREFRVNFTNNTTSRVDPGALIVVLYEFLLMLQRFFRTSISNKKSARGVSVISLNFTSTISSDALSWGPAIRKFVSGFFIDNNLVPGFPCLLPVVPEKVQ